MPTHVLSIQFFKSKYLYIIQLIIAVTNCTFFSILEQNTYTNIIVDVKFKYVLCITRIEANYGGLLWKFCLEFWYSNQGWSPFVLLYLENYALSKSVSTTESIEVWHTDNGDVLGGEVNSPPVAGHGPFSGHQLTAGHSLCTN